MMTHALAVQDAMMQENEQAGYDGIFALSPFLQKLRKQFFGIACIRPRPSEKAERVLRNMRNPPFRKGEVASTWFDKRCRCK